MKKFLLVAWATLGIPIAQASWKTFRVWLEKEAKRIVEDTTDRTVDMSLLKAGLDLVEKLLFKKVT